MSAEEDQDGSLKDRIATSWPLWIAGIFTVLFAIWVWFLTAEFTVQDGIRASRWDHFLHGRPNELGDTLAGFVGSLTLLWVISSVFQQNIELKAQRAEFVKTNNVLAEQKFETTFSEMLSIFNSIVTQTETDDWRDGSKHNGRRAFVLFYTHLNKLFREKIDAGHTEEQSLEMAYRNFWKEYQVDLGHYFRFLYNFLRLLSESPHARPYHSKVLRSQLSNQELLLLFYNCLTKDGEKMIRYAVEFALFDNLPTVRLLRSKHSHLIPKEAFGSNPMLTFRDMRHSINIPKRSRVE